MQNNDFCSVKVAATKLQLNKTTIYRWIKKGDIKPIRRGNKLVVSLNRVAAFCKDKGIIQPTTVAATTTPEPIDIIIEKSGVTTSKSNDNSCKKVAEQHPAKVAATKNEKIYIDQKHYEGLLIRLGQLESEKKFLLEYQNTVEAKEKKIMYLENKIEKMQKRGIIKRIFNK